MNVLCVIVTLVVVVTADYHHEIGIPLAARIKEYEDKLFAKVPEMGFRILGDVAPVFAHPYLVGLIIRLSDHYLSMCGASLISITRLVTAGHCVAYAESMKAVLGTNFLYHGGLRIITREFVTHPLFNESVSLDFDIGVVKLPQAVEQTETLHRIRIPEVPDDEVIVGEIAVAAGWGLSADWKRGEQLSKDLYANEAYLQVIDEEDCRRQYQSYVVKRNGICTSGFGGVGVCDGDSGGPLVVERKGQRVLIGVISHGHKPCNGGKPSVHIRVGVYRDFVNKALV